MTTDAPRYRAQAQRRRHAPAGVPIMVSSLPDTVWTALLLLLVLGAATCTLFYGHYTVRLRVPVTLRVLPAESAATARTYTARFEASSPQLAAIASGQSLVLHLASIKAANGVRGTIGTHPAQSRACEPHAGTNNFSVYLVTVAAGALPAQSAPVKAQAEIAVARRRLIDWIF